MAEQSDFSMETSQPGELLKPWEQAVMEGRLVIPEQFNPDDWHGWSRSPSHEGLALHIGPLPGRKSIALYTMDYRDGAEMRIHAYFRNEDEARDALKTLDALLSPSENSYEVEGNEMSKPASERCHWHNEQSEAK